MGKVKAYRNKQRSRSLSKGSDTMDDGGPLQQGMIVKGQKPRRRSHQQAGADKPSDVPQNAGMKEFFDRVSEAKVNLFWARYERCLLSRSHCKI